MRLRILATALTLCVSLTIACGSSSDSGSSSTSPTTTPTPLPNPAPAPPPTPASCVTFSPARAEPSSNAQSVTVQVVTTRTPCSWTATTSEQWITVRRTGALVQAGNGPLTFDVIANQDQNFGGCPTVARTGRITVTEETTRAETTLQVIQQGSTTAFQPGAGCVVAQLPYSATVSGSLGTNDCKVRSSVPARYYTFQGLPNQQITIAMTGGRFVSGGLASPLMTLYGPGGGFVVSAGGNVVVDNPRITRNLSCTGTFTLEVSSSLDSTFNPSGRGNYTLRLDSQN